MANRFGANSNYFEIMNLPSTHEVTDQKSRDKRDRQVVEEKKAQRVNKKRFISTGCGHKNINSFLSPHTIKKKPSVPVTENKLDNKKGSSKEFNSEAHDDIALHMNEVAEMIRNDHEVLDQDEQLLEELEVQELEDPVIETPTQIIDTTQSQIEQDTSDDDVEFIAVSYSNESISRGMKEYITRRSTQNENVDEELCSGCGGNKQNCHELTLGRFIVHEILTSIRGMEPHEATDEWLKSEFHQKYNLTLRFRCYMISDKYDEKEDYVLPACIVLGSLFIILRLTFNEQRRTYP